MDPRDISQVGIGENPNPPTTEAGQADVGQVKEQAGRLTSAVKRRAITTGEQKKQALAEHLRTLVSKLEGIAHNGNGSEPGASEKVIGRSVEWLRSVQENLENNSTEELLRKAEERITARPGLFIAGCLALGFIGARLVRK
jgi:hypothetical protein